MADTVLAVPSKMALILPYLEIQAVRAATYFYYASNALKRDRLLSYISGRLFLFQIVFSIKNSQYKI